VLGSSSCDLRAHAEHQLLPLAGGFHRLGGELRRAGHEGNGGRNHILGRGIQHDAHLAAQRHAAGHGFGQEEGHVHVRQIEEVQHTSARSQAPRRVRHAHLHAPVARRRSSLSRMSASMRLPYWP
jgi:hypothetical protein